MGVGDDAPVTWGRFTATITALDARVTGLEAAAAKGRDRRWAITAILLTGLALPVLVSLIGVWLHLGS